MRRTFTFFGILTVLLIGVSAVATTIVLRSYDVTRPDIGSGMPAVQTDSYPVVVLGDSLAAGTGASTPENGLAPQVYNSILAQHPDARLHNFGQNGATTGDVVSDQLPRLALVENPKVIILVIGTNDIIQQVAQPTFEKNWNEILSTIAQPGRNVIVLNIPKFASTPAVPDNLKAQADVTTSARNAFITRNLADKTGVSLVDFYGLSASELQPGSSLLSPDQFHPNDSGYSHVSDAVIKALKD